LSFINELKRRNVFRVGIAYIITAWLIAQVAGLAADSFLAPQWVMKMIITMLLLGFPLATFFAWAYELTPDGLRREPEVQHGQSITDKTARSLDRAIIYALVLALAWFTWDKFIADPGRDKTGIESAVRDAIQEPPVGVTPDLTAHEPANSIAVLPFVNMSSDEGNEYFADGLSEELLNMLVKIPELRVAARTSSFSFRDKDLKISEIAKELNVSHILEGSVRKSGERVRITAQLIKADDGFHLWSENFDRTLDDIFTLQDEIASKVAQALEVTLLGEPLTADKINPEAYVLLLKGLHFLRPREAESLRMSEKFLFQAIGLETGYSRAWAMLALNYYHQTINSFKTREEGVALVHHAIGLARSLDPDDGRIWSTYGYLKKNLDWDWSTAQAAINKAYELEPNSNRVRRSLGSMATTTGKLDEAIELYERVILDDPLSLPVHGALGNLYMKVHRYDEALAIFKNGAELNPDHHWMYFSLGKANLLRGDAEQALLETKKNRENEFRSAGLVMAYSTLGREAEAEKELQKLIFEYGETRPVWIAEAYSWRGEKDEAFEWLENTYSQRDNSLAYLLGNNAFYSLIDDPRWVDFLKKLNLLEYWLDMPAEYGGPSNPPD